MSEIQQDINGKEKEQIKKQQNGKKKRVSIKNILIMLACVLVLILFFFGGYVTHLFLNGQEIAKVNEMLLLIEKNGYLIDNQTGEEIDFNGQTVNKIVANYYLDKFSQYYTEEEYGNFIENGKGNYDGVGVAFNDDSTMISAVYGNSPAYKAGLKDGDVIESGEQHGVKPLTVFSDSRQVIAFMKECEEDKQISLFITREGEFTGREFSFYKGKYVCSYVEYCDSEKTAIFSGEKEEKPKLCVFDGGMENLPSDTAYIKLALFEGDAVEEIAKVMDLMESRGRTKLIFDLRNNGGGFLDILAEISGYFIVNDSDGLIVEAQMKNGKTHYSKGKDNFNEKITDIYVLANDNTASASECLIGAMLCYDGEIFNESKLIIEKNGDGVARTYGKGIMQTTFELLSGGALKITTAKLFWPDGRSIHGKGITATAQNGVEKGTATEKAISLINGEITTD